MTDPGEKAASSPQFWGTQNPLSTGAPGTGGHASSDPGEVPSSSNVFGTNVSENTGAPGTGGGQHSADGGAGGTHTAYSPDSNEYTQVSGSGDGVSPDYQPIVGTYPTDTGVGHGTLVNKPR